jgi:hypothetical protein
MSKNTVHPIMAWASIASTYNRLLMAIRQSKQIDSVDVVWMLKEAAVLIRCAEQMFKRGNSDE